MRMRTALAAALGLLMPGALFADFSYEQTSRMTGGAMMSMMKVVGAFSKRATEPTKTSVYIKGNRMAHVSDRRASVIDLDKETFTEIDFEKKTYSVLTFDQYRQALAGAQAKLAQRDKQGDAQMEFKVDVKETGNTKNVAGLNTREFLLTLTTTIRDAKTGQATDMVMQSDMWMAKDVPGHQEERAFARRMAQKISLQMNQGFAAMLGAGQKQGMEQMQKETAKMDGLAVLHVTKMKGAGGPPGTEGQPPQAQHQHQQQQQQQEEVQSPNLGGLAGRIGGGRLGGALGGFGRGRKQQQEQPAQQQQQQPPAQQQPQTPPEAGVLMEVTTEITGFSSGAIEASRFEVPAGFKQVESALQKQAR